MLKNKFIATVFIFFSIFAYETDANSAASVRQLGSISPSGNTKAATSVTPAAARAAKQVATQTKATQKATSTARAA